MLPARVLSKRTLTATISLVTASLMGLALLPGSAAHAAPTLAETERTLADLGRKLATINEQYNHAAVQLYVSRLKQAELQKKIGPYQAKADEYAKQVSLIGAAAYRGGRPTVLTAVMRGDSPQTVVDQLALLDRLGADEQGVIEALKEAKKPLADIQRKLDAEIAQQAKQEKELRLRKAQLDADMAKWKKIRAQVKPRASRSGSRTPLPVYDGAASGRAVKAVKYAYAQLGKPYDFGADGPEGFDCSGLTMMAWKQAGVRGIPHSAKSQYRSSGFPGVPRSALQPGDLVSFYKDFHHIGIYVGGGYMIHAPQPGENVVKVNINTSYWRNIYNGAVRPA